MTLLVQILGGIFGIAIAGWLSHIFTQRNERMDSEAKIQYQKELLEYKKSLATNTFNNKF